jgi:hypothetical protein
MIRVIGGRLSRDAPNFCCVTAVTRGVPEKGGPLIGQYQWGTPYHGAPLLSITRVWPGHTRILVAHQTLVRHCSGHAHVPLPKVVRHYWPLIGWARLVHASKFRPERARGPTFHPHCMKKRKSSTRERSSVVRQNWPACRETRSQRDGSQAVRMPPDAPTASIRSFAERERGRNDPSLKLVAARSFVS